MGNSPTNVLVPKFKASGGCYVSPYIEGGTRPNDASTALPVEYKALGYVGPDGLKRTTNTEIHEVLAAGGVKVKAVPKGHDVTYELTLMQTDLATLTEVFGPENVSKDPTTGVIRVRHNANAMPVRSWAWDLAEGLNSLRETCTRGQVTGVSDVVYGTGEEMGYAITITGLDDENGDKGNTWHEFGDGPESL